MDKMNHSLLKKLCEDRRQMLADATKCQDWVSSGCISQDGVALGGQADEGPD